MRRRRSTAGWSCKAAPWTAGNVEKRLGARPWHCRTSTWPPNATQKKRHFRWHTHMTLRHHRAYGSKPLDILTPKVMFSSLA
eukprot:2409205-Amphidinium_carterae.1